MIKVILFFIALCVAPFYEFFCLFVFVFSPFSYFLDCVPLSFSTFGVLFCLVLCRALLTAVIFLSFFPFLYFFIFFLPMS